jgi:predicted Zn-dependent protease
MITIQEELMLGLEAQQNQQFEVAARCYQRILSEEPEHPETNHAVGLLLIANEQVTDAIPFLAKALERRPEVDHLWFDCIDAMIGADDWDHAASLIERAREAGLPADELDLRDLRVLHGLAQRNLDIPA